MDLRIMKIQCSAVCPNLSIRTRHFGAVKDGYVWRAIGVRIQHLIKDM